jgi:3-hydroxyisobutyrate dehydrogenase
MQIGFAGLGAIGTPMAERLAQVHRVTVWNRTSVTASRFVERVAGVRLAATPAELADGADAIVTCFPTSADVSRFAAELTPHLAAGTILIDCTSGDPSASRELAAKLAERGIAFVDAPVSGGPPLAATGELTVMCGGSDVDVARASEVVAPFAGKVVHLGPVGAGHAMKAVNNILLAANILALGEGLVALTKFGIEPRAAVDVLNASSGRSFVSEALVPQRVLTGSWPALFRLALLEKDAGIAVDTALAVGTDHPVLDFVREEFRALRRELGEGADDLDPSRRAEQLAGVELRG